MPPALGHRYLGGAGEVAMGVVWGVDQARDWARPGVGAQMILVACAACMVWARKGYDWTAR